MSMQDGGAPDVGAVVGDGDGEAAMTITERFASLEESNRLLTEAVRRQARAIEEVNDLKRRQQESEDAARAAMRAAQRVERNRIETERRRALEQELVDARAQRTRRTLSRAVTGALILLPVTALVVFLGAEQRINELQHRTVTAQERLEQLLSDAQRQRVAACTRRNAETETQIRRERRLATVEKDGPEAVKAHLDSADELQKGLTNCVAAYPLNRK